MTAPVNTSRTTNYELQGTGWATRAPVAQTLQTVRQTCSCTTATCPFRFARFPSCGIFTPTLPVQSNTIVKNKNYEGALVRVAWHSKNSVTCMYVQKDFLVVVLATLIVTALITAVLLPVRRKHLQMTFQQHHRTKQRINLCGMRFP